MNCPDLQSGTIDVGELRSLLRRALALVEATQPGQIRGETGSGRAGDVLDRFVEHREAFTDRQWEVVELYYGEGLSDRAIGKRLDRSERAIWDRRHRALERLRSIERQRREERFRLTRKYADLYS